MHRVDLGARFRAAAEAAEPASIRLWAVLRGGSGDDHLRGTRFDDQIDLSQGGDDQLKAKAGDDAIYLGAALTGRDRIDGGGGLDTVTLEGDYSAGIRLVEGSLTGVERLELLGGSYVIEGVVGAPTEKFVEFIVDARQLQAGEALDMSVEAAGNLRVVGGSGDDVLRGSSNGNVSVLSGFYGDDTLIGSGATVLFGDIGADRIMMAGAGDVAFYAATVQSMRGSVDRIDNFDASGGRIEFTFDSDTSTPTRDLNFHLGRTEERVGDILVDYRESHDITVVKVFTDHDNKADFVLHLTGDVQLTTADFIFG